MSRSGLSKPSTAVSLDQTGAFLFKYRLRAETTTKSAIRHTAYAFLLGKTPPGLFWFLVKLAGFLSLNKKHLSISMLSRAENALCVGSLPLCSFSTGKAIFEWHVCQTCTHGVLQKINALFSLSACWWVSCPKSLTSDLLKIEAFIHTSACTPLWFPFSVSRVIGSAHGVSAILTPSPFFSLCPFPCIDVIMLKRGVGWVRLAYLRMYSIVLDRTPCLLLSLSLLLFCSRAHQCVCGVCMWCMWWNVVAYFFVVQEWPWRESTTGMVRIRRLLIWGSFCNGVFRLFALVWPVSVAHWSIEWHGGSNAQYRSRLRHP